MQSAGDAQGVEWNYFRSGNQDYKRIDEGWNASPFPHAENRRRTGVVLTATFERKRRQSDRDDAKS